MARKLYSREELVRSFLDSAYDSLVYARRWPRLKDAYESDAHCWYLAAKRTAVGYDTPDWMPFEEWREYAYAAIDACATNAREARAA